MNSKILEILLHGFFLGVFSIVILLSFWPSEVKKFINSWLDETPSEIIVNPNP
ncbi:MAG TPA: hypothetical protein VK211_23065 [Kamptonema sp.]|nr:hypothetical protein [Kamptonema sp.]